MMYMLRYPIRKILIPSRINLSSNVICPLCRICQNSIHGVRTYRLPFAKAKKFSIRLEITKRRATKKIGEFSELIRVEGASGNNVKESRAVIKKSSAKEILKNLAIPELRSLRKHAASVAASEVNKADAVDGNDSPKTRVTLLPLKSFDKKLSKKKSSEESRQQGKLVKTLPTVRKQRDAVGDGLYNLGDVDVISTGHIEPYLQGFNDECGFILANQGHSNNKEDEFQKRESSKTKGFTQSDELLQRKKSLKASDREKTSKIKKNDIDKSVKDLHLNSSLGAFLDVCVNSDMLNMAHSMLMCYSFKGRHIENFPKLTDVKLFNIVLSGHAQKGNWFKAKEILAYIQQEKIKPDLQTYASCLACISRLQTQDKQVIQHLLRDAEKNKLNIDNLDHECTFVKDQRECIIKMVRLVRPSFQPTPRKNLKYYSCNLTARLNEEPTKDYFYDPLGGTMTCEQLLSNLKLQMETEVTDKVVVRSIDKSSHKVDESLEKARSNLRECENNWRAVLLQAFKENLITINSGFAAPQFSKSVNLHPFLTTLDANVYVDLMLQEIQFLARSAESFSLSVTLLQYVIGCKVMKKYMIATKQKQGLITKIESLYQKYCEYYINPKLTSQYTPRAYWQKLVNENMDGPSIEFEENAWPGYIFIGVGKFLYDLILHQVKITRNSLKSEATKGSQLNAFYCIFRNNGLLPKEEIKPHPIIVHMYQSEMMDTLTFEGNVVPTLVPPLPYTSIRSGGYLLSSERIMRIQSARSQHQIRLQQTPDQQLFPIYDSLNQLGECPWKINKPILDIVIEMFNDKGSEALGIPPPSSEYPILPVISPKMSKKEQSKIYIDRERLKRKRAEMHSLRCDGLYKLSIANHFRDKIFWFPHNMDFRGRVYPCPPHFNHIGGDMSRGILLFAKGEPLGEKGLDWLKIHLINLTGLKKQDTISNRLLYANEMMPEIIDSSSNPLNGRRWWMKSDQPWQTLACCMEITNAVQSPDPQKYICHFPVHQDGSCNGLQHYAALGRDAHGAREVNLFPMDRPQDVYSGVAKLVEEQRAKDAKDGVEIAKVLEGFIKRKVIKQTVMTTVYGVTHFGARNQIRKQLKDLSDFSENKAWEGSAYLAEKTFQSLHQMFTATKDIQDWLTEVAKLISQVCGQSVEWVTPLGLPILQPYYKPSKAKTSLGVGKKYQTQSKMESLNPNVMKQKNAFPPNFIHSLDATHMMLTSLFCQREGITFVSVHDCYWTHPSKSIEIMNTICREQFVALHSEPILENLSKFLTLKYSYRNYEITDGKSVANVAKIRFNRLVANPPKTGNFDLKNVLQSTYFFS